MSIKEFKKISSINSSKPLKILLQSRHNLFSKSGGDTRQILQLQKDLKTLGHTVDVSLEIFPDLVDYDLVHCFNLTRLQETFMQILNARMQNTPCVLSPIFHNLSQYNAKGRYGWKGRVSRYLSYEMIEQIRNMYLWWKKECPSVASKQFYKQGYFNLAHKILQSVDGLVCNTKQEASEIFYFFKPIGFPKVGIIPIGLDFDELDSCDDSFYKKTKLKDYVLCVGRVEDLKNQLKIIEALKSSLNALVFIGALNDHHPDYCRKFQSLVNEHHNIYWFHDLERSEVLSAMKTANVHVLASYIETTGLANLEAGYLGAKVVSTQNGYSSEIFQNHIEYCDPQSVFSISQSVLRASKRESTDSLREYIVKNFQSMDTARKHEKFYRKILNPSAKIGGHKLPKERVERDNLSFNQSFKTVETQIIRL